MLLVDDLVATGGTMLAGLELIRKLGGGIVEAAAILEFTDASRRQEYPCKQRPCYPASKQKLYEGAENRPCRLKLSGVDIMRSNHAQILQAPQHAVFINARGQTYCLLFAALFPVPLHQTRLLAQHFHIVQTVSRTPSRPPFPNPMLQPRF